MMRQQDFIKDVIFSSGKAKTGVLMLNMGGPSHPDDTEDFLKRLFQDSDIIELGGGKFQELRLKHTHYLEISSTHSLINSHAHTHTIISNAHKTTDLHFQEKNA